MFLWVPHGRRPLLSMLLSILAILAILATLATVASPVKSIQVLHAKRLIGHGWLGWWPYGECLKGLLGLLRDQWMLLGLNWDSWWLTDCRDSSNPSTLIHRASQMRKSIMQYFEVHNTVSPLSVSFQRGRQNQPASP